MNKVLATLDLNRCDGGGGSSVSGGKAGSTGANGILIIEEFT